MKLLRKYYNRCKAMYALLRAGTFILYVYTPEKQFSIIRTNIADDRTTAMIMANAAKEIAEDSRAIDTLTNELGIKRAED